VFPSNATHATYETHARKYARKYVTNARKVRKPAVVVDGTVF